MRRARIDGLRPARGGAIALTITRCTKVRAALGHAPRNMAFGGTRIDTALGPRVRPLVTTAAFSTDARRIEFAHIIPRSEARRVGKECFSTGKYRWSPEY